MSGKYNRSILEKIIHDYSNKDSCLHMAMFDDRNRDRKKRMGRSTKEETVEKKQKGVWKV